MANAEIVATRRDEIAQRWLKGQSIASIARELTMPLGSVKHDLAFIRRSMLAGTADVVRLTRSRSMATIELVAAQAWGRLDRLSAQDEPDDGAMSTYLTIVLKAQAQAAKLAGIGGSATHLQEHVLNLDIRAWMDAQEKAKERAYQRALQYEDDEDEDEDEDEYERGKADGYARGLAEGAQQANEVALAAVREVAEQIKAEAEDIASRGAESHENESPPEPEPEPEPSPPGRRAGFDPPDEVDDADEEDFFAPPAPAPKPQPPAPASLSVFDQLVAEARAQQQQNGRQ